MKQIPLIILTFFIFNKGIAQTGCCPYISPIVVLPSMPTTGDNIKIATHTASPSLGNKVFYQHSISTDTILLTGCFYGGPPLAIQDYHDTTNIGTLSAGTYTIKYTAFMTTSSTDCNLKVDTSILISAFTVSSPNSIPSIYQDLSVTLYPNPARDNLVLKGGAFNYDVSIYDLTGRKMLEEKFYNQRTININNFPKGIYIVKLSDGLKIKSQKLLIE